MLKHKPLPELSSVYAIKAFLNVVWILVIIGTIAFSVFMPVSYIFSHIKDSKLAIYLGVVFLSGLLTLAILLWIIFHLRRLLCTVIEGNPYDILNPRRIRKIAYGVFAWIPIELSPKILRNILLDLLEPFSPLNLLNLNWRYIVMLFSLGAGILVIAKIFEVGVKLQQDQNLTV